MGVAVDACADQLGCTLLKEKPDGNRLPAEYWSHRLSPAERKHSATKSEFLGVVWSVLHLYHFRESHRLLLRTDHKDRIWI